jgi:FkbM family methyltransferase
MKCLRRNATGCANHNIAIHEVAVGDLVGRGVLVAEPDCGHSSVQPEGKGRKVEMVSLDHWMESPDAPSRIDVIKLDIEGGELAALEGARKLIGRFRPFIVCEALDEKTNKNVPGQAKLINYFASVNYTTHLAEGVHSPTIVAIPK